jgi:glycosyltransferase involved in cell wall biosynthesis
LDGVRIALVSTPFVRVPPPGYGGTELVVHVLSRALGRMGHEVTVYATGDSRVPRLRSYFDRPVWPPDPYSEMLHCRAAAREIAGGRFDVVHAHAPAMLAFADELEAPLVYTLHHAGDELGRYYAAVPGPVWRVAISARQAALAPVPVQAIVHHGLDPALYPDCGEGGPLAFFLGRLSWTKGPELAVEAARLAGLPIVVAGEVHSDDAPVGWHDGVLAPALRSPGVTWIRRANLPAKRRLFARARALLVPIRWEEPFGLVMIEALLAGCPVIAHPRGAAPEIVEEGRTGFLVSDVAAMAEALARAAALDRRAIQARARERFAADRMAAEYLAAYRAAGAGGRVPAAIGDEGWTTLAT